MTLLVADVSDIHHFLHAFHKPQAGLIQAARQLLSGEQAPLRQKLLADLLHTVSENTEAETRAEDPPWFEGTPGPGAGVGLAGSWPRRGHQVPPQSLGGGPPGFCVLEAPGLASLLLRQLWESVRDVMCSV